MKSAKNLYGTCWMASLSKHMLNASGDHYPKNVDIYPLSKFSSSRMCRMCCFVFNIRGLEVANLGCLPCNDECPGLDPLRNAGSARRGRPLAVARVSCFDIKLAAHRSQQQTLCLAQSAAPGLPIPKIPQ